jgi:hypothetical protein
MSNREGGMHYIYELLSLLSCKDARKEDRTTGMHKFALFVGFDVLWSET